MVSTQPSLAAYSVEIAEWSSSVPVGCSAVVTIRLKRNHQRRDFRQSHKAYLALGVCRRMIRAG